MLLRQFAQYILGLVFLVSSSLALSNAEFTYNVIDGGIKLTGCIDECPSDLVILRRLMVMLLLLLERVHSVVGD